MDSGNNKKDRQTKAVAILYICTGEYVVFWKEFYESYERFFLNECEKTYFVFTDYQKSYFDLPNVEVIYQEKLGWPYDTLMRFAIFSRVENKLKEFDYIFFMNANMKCVANITEEEFLPEKEALLFVQHPAFYNKNRKHFTYERNRRSTACVKKNEGNYYICGGVNGGRADAYIKLIQTLKSNIEKDLENKMIAVWHDESHINRYMIDHDNYRILGPSYCYPEGWKLPVPPKILVREKSNYIDVGKIKGERRLSRIKKHIMKLIAITR